MELVLNEAMRALLKFRKQRDWEKFHTPKDLSISICLEAAELMEHFQWKSEKEIVEYLGSEKRNEVAEEIADIFSYLLFLCNDLELDINKTILDKIKKNEEKYPVEKCMGKNNKYNEL